MPTAHDHYSQQFQKWEVRGRGWQVFPEPVSPEPPFVPFGYRKMTETLAPDDGRKPTLLSSLMRKVANTVAPKTCRQDGLCRSLMRSPSLVVVMVVPALFRLDRSLGSGPRPVKVVFHI